MSVADEGLIKSVQTKVKMNTFPVYWWLGFGFVW